MRRFSSCGFLSCMLAATAFGQPAVAQDGPAVPKVELNLGEETDLAVLIEYVSREAKVPILYEKGSVSSSVSVKIPTPIKADDLVPLLESVLKFKGLVLTAPDTTGLRRIVPRVSLASVVGKPVDVSVGQADGSPVSRVFKLDHVDATVAEGFIKPFLTPGAGLAATLASSKSLLVCDFADRVEIIEALIVRIDVVAEPPATQWVPLAHTQTSDTAAEVERIVTGTQPAGSPAMKILSVEQGNQLLLVGTVDQIRSAIDVVKKLDVARDVRTRLFPLQHVSPQRLDRLVRQVVLSETDAQSFRSVVDDDGNALVVIASDAVHAQIEQLIERIDKPLSAEQNPVRFYKLQNSAAADVVATIREIEGVTPDAAAGFGARDVDRPARAPARQPVVGMDEPAATARPVPDPIGAPQPASLAQPSQTPFSAEARARPPTSESPAAASFRSADASLTADPNTNSVVVVASPERQQQYERLIRELDVRRPQVMIECTIVTVDTSDNFSLGVELGGSRESGGNRLITFSALGVGTPNVQTGLPSLLATPAAGLNSALLLADDFSVVLNALATASKTTVVSAPRILVNDNATGTLTSVSEEPFTSTNASNTVATTSFAGYATAGTSISVVPRISEGDHLQLEYKVTLNSFKGEGDLRRGIPPPRATDTVSSEVTIPDGAVIVVGGLNRKLNDRLRRSVPVLGELPVVGALFGGTTEREARQTLFVFLRPVVLRADRFEDLKTLSIDATKAAGVDGGTPVSKPVLMR
jgi:general secretion pathway protein D